MRGSVGNSGNQGGKCLGIFRLGVSSIDKPKEFSSDIKFAPTNLISDKKQ